MPIAYFNGSQARGPESGNVHLELVDAYDAHATYSSILLFYLLSAASTLLRDLFLDGQAALLGMLSIVAPALFRLTSI